jgi:hypothetical protein
MHAYGTEGVRFLHQAEVDHAAVVGEHRTGC